MNNTKDPIYLGQAALSIFNVIGAADDEVVERYAIFRTLRNEAVPTFVYTVTSERQHEDCFGRSAARDFDTFAEALSYVMSETGWGEVTLEGGIVHDC